MPAGRPSVSLKRQKWFGVKETEWCAFAMERQADWLPVLGLEPFDRFDLEFQVQINGSGARKDGLPRIDAVGWRREKATLIEAKVEVSPSSMMGGVGQLLYYAEICRRVLKWDVERLILISPAWPAFLAECVETNRLPVDLVMATPETFYGMRSDASR